jgi:tetratricopeptide (TPR) repeat protein
MTSGVARFVVMALLLALAGCSSPEEKAAKAATRFDVFYAKRDFWSARTEIKKAIAAQDENPEYWLKLARVELADGRYLAAFSAYEHVVELEKENDEALQGMAELAYAGGNTERSEELSNQVLERQPRSLRMLLVKGSIAAAQHEASAARAVAEQMLEIDPTNEGGTILLARALFLGGNPQLAVATLRQSIAKDGETVSKLMALLDLYAGRNDFRNMARTFARLFALQPRNIDIRLDYVRVLYEQGLPDRALGMLTRLTRRRPGDTELQQRIVDIWNEMGSEMVDVEKVRRFVMAGGIPQMKVALGRLLIERQRYAEAEAVLRPYVDKGDITARNVEADVHYAGALSGLGRRREALDLVDRLLDFDDNNPRALLMRVRIAVARGVLVQALRDAQLLVRDNPAMMEGRVALADIYVRRNEPILADDAYAQAMNDLSQDSGMLAAYVRYLLGKDRTGMARDATKRFTRENPRSRDGWRERGRLCIRLGDAECVGESFNALDRIPGGPRIRYTLEASWTARGGTARRVKAAAGQPQASCGSTGAGC